MAAPLDLEPPGPAGAARSLHGGLLATDNSLVAFYETSNTSHVTFVRGRYQHPVRRLVWVDRHGRQKEVYVQRFPLAGPRVQVSRAGGEEPLWSRDGNELYFRNGRQVLAATVGGDAAPRVSEPVVLFEGRYHFNLYPTNTYDVGPDGRFLMVEEAAPIPRAVHVVLYLGDSWRQLAGEGIAQQDP